MAADVKEAAAYTRKSIASLGYSPQGLVEWISDWVPDRFTVSSPHYEEMEKNATDQDSDEWLVATTKLIQQWVYDEPGDAALGVRQHEASTAEVDGKLGSGTHRRMLAWEAFAASRDGEPVEIPSGTSYLIANGEKIPVPGVAINHDKFSFELACEGGKRCYSRWKRDERATVGEQTLPSSVTCLGTVHWDVCGSAATCFKVLKKNRLSSVFGVDNPGPDGNAVVYQWLDFGRHYGWHGGKANKHSLVSFDMSNLVYTKYADRYKDRVGIPRPVIVAYAHGKKRTILGMYRAQIMAMLRVSAAIAMRFERLTLTFPEADGRPVSETVDGLFDGGYPGLHSHLAITTNKYDVCGLEEQIIYLMRKAPVVASEFPSIAAQFAVSDDAKWGEWEKKRDKIWTWTELTG